jgi:hypothetical protein
MDKLVVTDRVLVLGLDGVYRADVKKHESSILLSCARTVARALKVDPAKGPIEGYYVESEQLSEYFQLARALQATEVDRRCEVERMPTFCRLLKVFSSRIYGYEPMHNGLLPAAHDSLAAALRQNVGHWEMDALLKDSKTAAIKNDDYSIVGLASRLDDGVCATAVRETVVLYAEIALTADNLDDLLQEPEYQWKVSDEMEEQANRFIDEYNLLFESRLPAARPQNAKLFYDAHSENELEGRCVRIGIDIQSEPIRYYHFKIDRSEDGELMASDFWSEDLWTTERYRQSLRKKRGDRTLYMERGWPNKSLE